MSETDSPLGLVLDRARAAILGYKVAVDITCFDGTYNGTQVATLELIRALVRRKDKISSLALIKRDDTVGACPPEIEELVNEVVTVAELKKRKQPAFDLVHRPFQVYALEDLELLQQVASRFVITQLDSLAYTVPGYAASPDWWSKVRQFTRLALGSSDGIIFISQEAKKETARHGLQISEDRSCVTYVGVEPRPQPVQSKPPTAAEQLTGFPFILMIGANYRHKNRLFVLRLFAKLLELYEWPGKLVFAGPSKMDGGSSPEETEEISRNPWLAERVLDLGEVDENEKQWLLENTGLLLYPSTVEGFGMVPFEAAWANTPALTSRISALEEILGDNIIYLESFEPANAAHTVWRLLSQPDLAGQQIAAIQKRAAAFSWDKVAGETWAFYRQILGKPPHISKTVNRQLAQYSELEDEYRKLEGWAWELNKQLSAVKKRRWWTRIKFF